MRKEPLRSILAVPKVSHALLPREKISALIDGASLDEAVCLVAPYGYGKTSAVISWLQARDQEATWLTLGAADNSAESLFMGLAAAITRPGGTGDILADPGYQGDAKGYLLEAVSAADPRDAGAVLVIDGLQAITDHALVAAVKDIVTAMLGHWRVILISRAELPPVFNDLFLRGNIRLITIKELAFNPDEIEEFFRINGCAASSQDALAIHEKTEGWPVSLNVVLTLSRGGSVSYNDAARGYIMAFFETEIWTNLDEHTREFLLKTSILDKLTPGACNTVTDMGATLPVLRRLFVNGLFISKLDEEDAFQYHRVFRDFLLEKLDASSIDARKLYKKIAWRLFEADKFEQAIPYFFKAGDLYGLSRVLRIINSTELGIEKYIELVGCITDLQVEDLREYPLIAAKMAQIHFDLGNIAEMQRIYEILAQWVEPGVLALPPEEYAECVWEVGWLSYLNPAEHIEKNMKHSQWINYSDYDPRVRDRKNFHSAAYRFPSVLRGLRDYCPALNSIEEFARLNQEVNYVLISEERALWQIDIIRAEYAYELENFAFAEKLARDILLKVESREITDLYFVCAALLVKIMRATRGANGIETLTLRLKKMIEKTGYVSLLPRLHALEVRNRLAEGHPGQTEAFAAENQDYLDKPYFFLLYRHITLARALLSTGEFFEALLLLNNLGRLCHQYNRTMDLMEVNILKSVAEHGLAHDEEARRDLLAAIESAREYGFIRIFSDDAPLIWPILEALKGEKNDAYLRNIVISSKKALARFGRGVLRKDRDHAGLTKAERKILGALNTGMTYEEIAFDNSVALSTVKTHIYAIYSKLDVHSRTSAVKKARDLGLIE